MFLSDVLPNELVVSEMEWKWFFPEVVFEIMEQLISLTMIPMLRDRSSYDEVEDVGKPRSMA